MIENIRNIYAQICDKKSFCLHMERKTGKKYSYILSHWFSPNRMNIPSEWMKICLKESKKWLKKEVLGKQKVLNEN